VHPFLPWKSNKYYIRVFVALGIQHAISMHHIAMCGLTVFKKIFTLSHKGNDFRKKLLNIKCVLIFSTNLSEILVFLILRITEIDTVKNVY
jgi:hypothetical protein